jgi:hypothetical protein
VRSSPIEPSDGTNTPTGRQVLLCPACSGANSPDAVFYYNPACHKAFGDFKSVLEELRAEMPWHQILADNVTRLIAKPHLVVGHFLWLAVWVALNLGIIAYVKVFHDPPCFILVTIWPLRRCLSPLLC